MFFRLGEKAADAAVLRRKGHLLIHYVLQAHIVGNHRNKLRVGGLAAVVLDGVAEIRVQSVDVAPIPRNLNGVANGTLHTGGGRGIFLRNGGVEYLGYGIDDIVIGDGH